MDLNTIFPNNKLNSMFPLFFQEGFKGGVDKSNSDSPHHYSAELIPSKKINVHLLHDPQTSKGQIFLDIKPVKGKKTFSQVFDIKNLLESADLLKSKIKAIFSQFKREEIVQDRDFTLPSAFHEPALV